MTDQVERISAWPAMADLKSGRLQGAWEYRHDGQVVRGRFVPHPGPMVVFLSGEREHWSCDFRPGDHFTQAEPRLDDRGGVWEVRRLPTEEEIAAAGPYWLAVVQPMRDSPMPPPPWPCLMYRVEGQWRTDDQRAGVRMLTLDQVVSWFPLAVDGRFMTKPDHLR